MFEHNELKIVYVEEDFDEVVEKFWPLQQPATAIEVRANNIFTDALTGNRILIKTPCIVMIEENASL